jgi:molybdopterin synthase catalytic subunit
VSEPQSDQRIICKIVDRTIVPGELEALVLTEADGAVCTFLGVARKFSRGREVVHLEYEAYPEMAEKKMAEIGEELREKFGVERVAMLHRVGVLEIGEASVGIAVASPHRKEAFEACRYAIDTLKATVPIWKKEVWADGQQWIGWEGQAPAGLAAPASG